MNRTYENLLKSSAQRALIYNIPPDVRQISVDISQAPLIRAVVCSNKPLSEDDIESIYSAFGEICGDFPDPHTDSEVSFIVDQGDIMSVYKLPIVIFSHSR